MKLTIRTRRGITAAAAVACAVGLWPGCSHRPACRRTHQHL